MTLPQPMSAAFEGYVLRLPGGQVLLGSQAVLDVLRVTQKVAAAYRVDAMPVPTRVRTLIEVLELALAQTPDGSAGGSAVLRPTFVLPPSERRVGVAQAAVILGVSQRRIRFIAEELGGRKLGSRPAWIFDRQELEEFARQRAGGAAA